MNIERVLNPSSFLYSLGGLHDVRISHFQFEVKTRKLVFVVEDLNANFTDLPEYAGSRHCKLIFSQVETFLLDVETFEGVRIADATISEDGSKLRLEVDLNLGGGELTKGRSISATFMQLHIEDYED